ncbi:hypothetical protein DsansV1_C02g0021501 [Dioscorea sansibarensis]
MAASSKFDLSSPDGPTYLNGQRGSYGAISLERTGSFCEGSGNRLSSLLPSMSRSSSTLSQSDMSNMFQSLFSDLRTVFLDQRFLRTLEIRKGLSSILGLSPEDPVPPTINTKPLPPSSLEELRRMRANLSEGSIKARERAKAFAEAVSKLEEYCPNLSKKRPRGEISSSDRSNSLFPVANMPKVGPQTHMNVNSLELGPQKMEERAKATVANRRVRTSMMEGRMDARANGIARSSGLSDKDKEIYKLVNGGSTPSEEKVRALTSSVEGWEKPKLKKKRSVIKSDVSASAVITRPLDSDREPKRGTQQKLGNDARPRLSNTHGFRSGPVNGTIGSGKSDLASPQNSLGMRPSPRNDQDNSSLSNDRRDRALGLDKEGSMLKAANKQNGREENLAGSPTPLTKLNASVRAPRSNPGSLARASPNTHRISANTDDWDHSQTTNKVNGFNRGINRKCSSSQLASSPVAQLVGQRPQKMSRVARRSNLSPLTSSHDEFTLPETVETASINADGLGAARHLSSNTQIKLKADQTLPASLLENKDPGVTESKSRDKTRKCSEIEEKSVQSIQKVTTLILPSRKNKVAAEEDTGDGVRRQGRIGRGYATTTSIMHATFEKLDNASTIKQMRSARAGSEKIESKPGRPPSKKLSERRGYTRPRHSVTNACLESAGESDDDHEELSAAANAAVNTMRACPNSFWKQIEPIFRFLSAEDITYLNQQIHLMDESCVNTCADAGGQNMKDNFGYVSTSAPGNRDADHVSNGTGLTSCESQKQITSHIKQDEPLLEQLVRGSGTQSGISICQALLSAIIEEEEIEKFYYGSSKCEEYSYEDAYGVKHDIDTQLNPNGFHFPGNFQTTEGTHNGAKIHCWKYHDELLENNFENNNGLLEGNAGATPRHGNSLDEFFPNRSMTSCTDFEYNQMSINDRILLELSEIGLHPEPVPDLTQSEEEDIADGINNLEEKLLEQVKKIKSLLLKLEKTVKEAREDQDRKLECIAMDMLVGLAYNKYMACWGPNATGSKSMNKSMKHATLAFVKRTLAKCQKFVKTGSSCFNEPAFKDIFLSISSCSAVKEGMDMAVDGEASKKLTSSQHSENTISDLSPGLASQVGQRLDTHEKYSNSFRPLSQSSEQPNGREEPWLNKVKRRELLLDDVVGSAGAALRPPSGLGSSLSSGTKGKRSGRDRDGRGQNKDNASRVSTVKIGRPSLSNVKGERKNKTKPKQKLTQLSASVNGLLSRTTEPSESGPKLKGTTVKDDLALPPESAGVQDLCNLQLPELDVGDFGGQGQDIGSWLNIDDDDVLQDHDFMGLEIPMDDLSEVNMML